MQAQGLIHLDKLKLLRNPFPMAPDASNYFLSSIMREHLVEILHCIDARMGFILITGDVGIGKTTLSRYLLKELDTREISAAIVLNTFLQGESLLGAINRDYGINDKSGMEQKIAALNAFFLDRFMQGKNCVIMVDDAQNLSLESLELIRQISNLETEQKKLVQIVLIAQPEILDTLARRDIRQLNSRIALTVRMPNLSRHDLGDYIQFRLDQAGGNTGIRLSPLALRILYRETHGFPRRVNLMMDRCLYAVAAHNKRLINASLMHKAASEFRDFHLRRSRSSWRYGMLTAAAVMIAMIWAQGWKTGMPWPGLSSWHASEQHALAVAPAPSRVDSSAPIQAAVGAQTDIHSTGKGVPDMSVQAGIVSQTKNYAIIKAVKSAIPAKAGAADKSRSALSANFHLYLKSPEVAVLQRKLGKLGFYPYPVDGRVGGHTVSGIAQFQSMAGLSPTGYPDADTLDTLQRQINADKNGSSSTQIIMKDSLPNRAMAAVLAK